MTTNRNDTYPTVRFGDVARTVRNIVDPETSGLERYIAGEHMTTDDLRLRSWGTIGDGYLGPAFHMKFEAGQILYGSRRTYLRKVAVADFDGICANTTFVIEAIPDRILPDLLPFIMQTESFTQHSILRSRGSTNPYVTWSDIARYEFPLPPLDEQRRIAEILWAVEDAIERYLQSQNEANILKNAMNSRLTLGGNLDGSKKKTRIGEIPLHWQLVSVGDVLKICQYGISDRADDRSHYPIFRMMNIVDGLIVENDMKYIDLDDDEFQKYRLLPGDILFNRTNSFDLVGKVGIYQMESNHVFASYLIRLRANTDRIYPEYLNFYLNSTFGQAQIRRFITPGVSQSNINARNLQKVPIPLPPLGEQQKSIELLSEVGRNADALGSQIVQTSIMKQKLLQRLLEGQSDLVRAKHNPI